MTQIIACGIISCMRLKNILIVVSDMERSKKFYHELFGLQIIRDFGDNVILSEGLVLQEQKNWEQLLALDTITGNASELFFEENDLDAFFVAMENYSEQIWIVKDLRENPFGRRAVIIADPDGHLIEIAEA